MSESENQNDKPAVGRKRLSLKRGVEQSTVRQSFSHGRSKAVVVEKRKRKITAPGSGEATGLAGAAHPNVKANVRQAAGESLVGPASRAQAQKRHEASSRAGDEDISVLHEKKGLSALTAEERDARLQALTDAKIRAEEERKRAILEEAERAKHAEEERLREEQEERRLAEEKTAQQPDNLEKETKKATAKQRESAQKHEPEERQKSARGLKRHKDQEQEQPGKSVRRGEERRRGKLTLANALDDEEGERARSLASLRRRREREKQRAAQLAPRDKISREVTLPETITIQELSSRMAERAVDVIKLLMQQGQMLKINDVIDADTAELIAEEMGHTVKRVSEADVEEGLLEEAVQGEGENLQPRPPVVTIMGHVDHGKTSLLDAFRETSIVSGEAGGITQHIGAYQVEHNNQKITFIDTPGHAAFTAMRARGAQTTDIVVLVVAADDGVMPQTQEAIAHAKAAGAPILIAINKIDKPGADPARVRTELLSHGVVVESMSGEVLEVEVSALKRTNLDKLLETILLQAELMELAANPGRRASGTVVEAKLDKGRGPVATVLVQNGTLYVGDILVLGSQWGKVRALIDDRDNSVKSAGPSTPVEVLGLQGTPEAGDMFAVVESEARAREVSQYRQRKKQEKLQASGARGSLEQMMQQLQAAKVKEFPLLIKADAQGSLEAILGALEKLGTEEVIARAIYAGVGGITETDITLAGASHAAVIGFNVRANKQARQAAEASGAEIRYYNIIYDLINDVKAAMSGMLSPERREHMLGNAEILEVFSISKVGKVAGCLVTEGTVERGQHVRLIRDDVVIHEGRLSTLKRFKDEVKEVNAGQECGMAFENYQDIRAGDVIECYRVEEVARTL